MFNVIDWFGFDNSSKLEEQVKYFIATTVEGYLNGCYDDNYKPMTKEEWKKYVWEIINYEKDMIINGEERRHLYYFGKDNFMRLTEEYLNEYLDVQPYIKKEPTE